ncbi:MAG: peptidylprolyl isomerase [Saprospiraceae bacterium]|nr:peptidylprolyl isomerase [Saprospiraceae bacterium]
MFKRAFSIFCLFFLIAFNAIAQGDPVLFTVGGKPTTVSEFKYIYSKTNQDKADFSEASLRDYLDLYVKFKLKVAKAREMQLDTIPSLQGELEGYRRQLAKSYLEDREVTEKLSREAYDRMVQDVDISHIFVACDKNAKPADTLKAYARINRILKLVQSGKDFGQVALDSTEDKVSKDNRGRLGYLNAMLPDGFYTLERAIYSAKAGSIVGPVRSNTGYHIAYVHSFRPARGEMEVGQILFRKGDTEDSKMKARLRADSAYAELKAGAKWEDACQRWSDDKATVSKAGYIGFFGINRYQKTFEEAAFGLEKDGDYSLPVETTIGWHIIRRVSKRQVGAYDTMKKIIADRIKRDSRSELAKQSMIARIRKEGNYEAFDQNLAKWSGRQVDSIFHTFKWKPDPARPQEPLVRYGANKTYTVADF